MSDNQPPLGVLESILFSLFRAMASLLAGAFGGGILQSTSSTSPLFDEARIRRPCCEGVDLQQGLSKGSIPSEAFEVEDRHQGLLGTTRRRDQYTLKLGLETNAPQQT